MNKIVAVILISNFLVSCVGDPGRRIILKCTEPNTSISIYGDSTLILQGDERTSQGILRTAVPSDLSATQKFHFGMGTWNDQYLKEFSNHIDSIVIIDSKGTQRMTDSGSIFQYFVEHRSGLYQNFITIKAN